MCPHCRAFITSSDRVCPYCNEPVAPRAYRPDSGGALSGFIPHARFVTMMILLVNFALYIATALYSMRSGAGGAMDVDGRTLFAFGAKFSPYVFAGQWWRLVTAGFLHGGILHILMNSWVLFDLGAQVEEVFGGARLMVLYFVATVMGFLASSFWSPSLSVGASAGIFGLIGAMIALGTMHRSEVGDHVRGMYMRYAVYMLLFGLLPGLRVDNAAHIGGLVGGFATAYLARLPGGYGWTERFWRVASYVCLGLTALSFLKMYQWFGVLTQ